jgi:Uma2 family endonuclease
MDTPKPDTLTLAGIPAREPHYPERDGKPVGETDFHISAIFYLRQALKHIFRGAETTYVAADMLLYYEEGMPSSVICPDVFVVKGVGKHDRRTYKLWEEKATPCVVFEVTSRTSRIEDQATKRGLYEILGVREYFLFDPLDEYLVPRLQGFRLVEGSYQRIPASPDGTMRSEEIGFILRPEGPLLKLVDPVTDRAIPTLDEAMDLARAEESRAEAEARRAENEARRAENEARRAENEARRAENEARRAAAAEAEVARLRALLSEPPRPA